ncbi:MAG: hypothetical protein WC223_11000 [Bacteroidales bacterium]|jgi:hypothetical protein
MGQFLSIGICNQISVNRKEIKKQGFKLTDVENELNKKFNLSVYVFNETDSDYLTWNINKSIFKQETHRFLSKIYQEYGEVNKAIEELLKEINNLETAEELFNLAESKRHENFQLDEYCSFDYIKLGAFEKTQRINTTYIGLFFAGKISMECYGQMFSFFRKTIRQVYSEFKLSGALNVYITG